MERLLRTGVKQVFEDGEIPSVVMDSRLLCRSTTYPWLRGLWVLAWRRSPPRFPKDQSLDSMRDSGSRSSIGSWVGIRGFATVRIRV